MPYIKQGQRASIDVIVKQLSDHISGKPVEDQDGMVNYAITKLLKSVYPERYFHYNRAMGVLECIKSEFYRRQVASYEDKKIADNGDVK